MAVKDKRFIVAGIIAAAGFIFGRLAVRGMLMPQNNTRENYGLVVYLHAGGFTSGDKTDDAERLSGYAVKGMLQQV